MENPVVWFEILGKDGEALKKFYGDVFNWEIKSDTSRFHASEDEMVIHTEDSIGGELVLRRLWVRWQHSISRLRISKSI